MHQKRIVSTQNSKQFVYELFEPSEGEHTATHLNASRKCKRDNTLQHTATHCNTLQHTNCLSLLKKGRAHGPPTSLHTEKHTIQTHCNTSQHTAIHHSTLQQRVSHIHVFAYLKYVQSNILHPTAAHLNALQQRVSHIHISAYLKYIHYKHTATHCYTL